MEEEEAEAMVNSIEPHLSRQTKRSCALSAREQSLVALRYLATGGQFRLVGDAHGVSPATVSRCVHRVVAVINDVFFNDVVKFPDRGECFDIPARFREVTKLYACLWPQLEGKLSIITDYRRSVFCLDILFMFLHRPNCGDEYASRKRRLNAEFGFNFFN